jgi:hypothetical protein
MLLAVAVATIVPFIPIGGDTRFYLPAAFAYLILLTMVGVIVGSSIKGGSTSPAVLRARRRLSGSGETTS